MSLRCAPAARRRTVGGAVPARRPRGQPAAHPGGRESLGSERQGAGADGRTGGPAIAPARDGGGPVSRRHLVLRGEPGGEFPGALGRHGWAQQGHGPGDPDGARGAAGVGGG